MKELKGLQDSVKEIEKLFTDYEDMLLLIEMSAGEDEEQEAAEEMGYSDAYFSKLFKQYFNQNFTAYLTEYRIKKAKELLGNTNNSIKDISRMVGYTDSNYFAKIFKRIVGEIPSKYRENL